MLHNHASKEHDSHPRFTDFLPCRWYHADSFGYSPEVAAAMNRFQCPKCRRKGMPSGCPLANPAVSLATPLKIRPKLHRKSRVEYVAASEGCKDSALRGQRRGLSEGPKEKVARKAGQSEGSNRPPRSIPVSGRSRTGGACGSAVLTARAVVTKHAGSKKDSLLLAEASCALERRGKETRNREARVEQLRGEPPRREGARSR